MKTLLLSLFVVMCCMGVAAQGTFLDDAVIKAHTKSTAEGSWYVTATVMIKKRDGTENILAVGRVISFRPQGTGFGLVGSLPMTINGSSADVNSLYFTVSQGSVIELQRLIAGKPFLGRQAQAFNAVLHENYLTTQGRWNGADIDVRVELTSEFRKAPLPPIPTAAKETAAQIIAKTPGLIAVNTVFVKNQPYYSPDKKHYLIFQGDGNLVVYRIAGTAADAVWNTGTNKSLAGAMAFGTKAVFQMDGNLVVYDSKNRAVWDSFSDLKRRNEKKWYEYFEYLNPVVGIDSESPTPYSKIVWLAMQDDGNLVVYRGSHPPVGWAFWSSK